MTLVAQRFSASARSYDETAYIQPIVAQHLLEHISLKPQTILEIGCGTGGLSAHLIKKFPDSKIILSDISEQMLSVCRQNIGKIPAYRVVDADNIPADIGSFDLIISNLALQWVMNLPSVLQNLIKALNPGGTLCFSILGDKNFKEWRSLLEKYGVLSGLHDYPSKDSFCWPAPYKGSVAEEFLQENHNSGADFLKKLKKIGASTARKGHRPIPASAMKQILKVTENGFTVSYHVLYGMLTI